MLKEIKMLHNKITKTRKTTTMGECEGVRNIEIIFFHNFITHPSRERQLHETIQMIDITHRQIISNY